MAEFDVAAALRWARFDPGATLTRRPDHQLPFVGDTPEAGQELLLDTCVYIDGLRARPMPVAVTGGGGRGLRIAARWPRPSGVARARQHLVELSFEHRLQEFPGSLAKASFDRSNQLSKSQSVVSISDRGRQGVVIVFVMA